MDEFYGTGGMERCGHVGREDASGFEAEDGADAFASGKNGIAHGLMDRRRRSAHGRQQTVQGCIHQLQVLGEEIGESHRESLRIAANERGCSSAASLRRKFVSIVIT